ncbi:hypothetical protein [Rhodoblastus sp.]|uniref:hypothetical protein n=1 Tax=Rhodoblastus sp. TaxID=1962975 RepID=UPI0035B355D0
MQDELTKLSAEEESKDAFFQELAQLSEKMVAAHGKDFSMGALLLAVRWIAEGKLESQSAG